MLDHPVAIAAALLLVLAIAGAWLMYETRGTTLWFDEWLWALEYRDGLHTFIAPHNGHPTLVPFTIYRLLFATVGIDHSAPYRAVGIAGHLLVVALLYVYSARRAGVAVGLLAAGSILLLGPGWQNIIWPLQIGWPISIACGLGALLALDRRDRQGRHRRLRAARDLRLVVRPRRRDRGRAVVEVLRGRGWRSAWIVAVPLALFAVWYLAYQDTESVRRELTLAPGFVADSAAATLSALAGLAGPMIGDEPVTLAWGRPLAVLAFALLAVAPVADRDGADPRAHAARHPRRVLVPDRVPARRHRPGRREPLRGRRRRLRRRAGRRAARRRRRSRAARGP